MKTKKWLVGLLTLVSLFTIGNLHKINIHAMPSIHSSRGQAYWLRTRHVRAKYGFKAYRVYNASWSKGGYSLNNYTAMKTRYIAKGTPLYVGYNGIDYQWNLSNHYFNDKKINSNSNNYDYWYAEGGSSKWNPYHCRHGIRLNNTSSKNGIETELSVGQKYIHGDKRDASGYALTLHKGKRLYNIRRVNDDEYKAHVAGYSGYYEILSGTFRFDKKINWKILKQAKKRAEIKKFKSKIQYYERHINNFSNYEYKANNNSFNTMDNYGSEKELLNSYKKDLMNSLNRYQKLIPSQKHYYDSSINQVDQNYNKIISNINNDIRKISTYNSYQNSIVYEQNNISKLNDKLSDDERQYSLNKEQFNYKYSNPSDESLGYHPWQNNGSIDNIEYTIDKNGLKKLEQNIESDKQEIVNEQDKIRNNNNQLNALSN